MAPPYTIRWGLFYERASAPEATLDAAIDRCRSIRAQVPSDRWPATIYGDNIDLDCADGLNADERTAIDEAGLA